MTSLVPRIGISPLLKEDLDALRDAVRRLETQSFAVRTAQAIGAPIAKGLEALPQKYSDIVQNAARQAIEKSLEVAINSLGRSAPMTTGNAFHKLMAGASGAVGGFFGLAALAVELPGIDHDHAANDCGNRTQAGRGSDDGRGEAGVHRGLRARHRHPQDGR